MQETRTSPEALIEGEQQREPSGIAEYGTPAASRDALSSFLEPLIKWGSVTITRTDGSAVRVGATNPGPQVSIAIKNSALVSRIAKGGSLALGESYVDGWWSVEGDDLVTFFRILFMNGLDQKVLGSFQQRLLNVVRAFTRAPTDASRARQDVRWHYDLGNDFFALMLDPSMTYSCGYARSPEDSLEKMQEQKYERIAAKLGLKRGGTLIDIGCGWGGFLAYVARNYPEVRGLGVTLSDQQAEFARERLKAQGVSERFQVAICDYRDLSGEYDFVVSVGMFEHVGRSSYPLFFAKMRRLIRLGGVGLLHTIGAEEPLWRGQDPWIDTYIFPGSRLPRLEELTHEARVAGLAIGHVENWRPHYALTLRHWRENFVRHWHEVQELDNRFDQRFYRLWSYYLQICEACFIDSTVELYQMLVCPRGSWNFPLAFSF